MDSFLHPGTSLGAQDAKQAITNPRFPGTVAMASCRSWDGFDLPSTDEVTFVIMAQHEFANIKWFTHVLSLLHEWVLENNKQKIVRDL